ncbi:hypothetical protein AMETH_4895 [Amycolatopsis methanolica 239]|uniref:DUF1801 domain-containing protein n=1 Tax=Amycolatopsis methanolica 239 TaxID=1068978 RepID=A0A076N4R7_AMYME|nr:hypothetical protein AMETH_4895 [Amycolatopsis methanolica 239]
MDTPDSYIDALDEPHRSNIRALHELIRETVPELAPTTAFGMLGYGCRRPRSARAASASSGWPTSTPACWPRSSVWHGRTRPASCTGRVPRRARSSSR